MREEEEKGGGLATAIELHMEGVGIWAETGKGTQREAVTPDPTL